jgi:hypothetical protein
MNNLGADTFKVLWTKLTVISVTSWLIFVSCLEIQEQLSFVNLFQGYDRLTSLTGNPVKPWVQDIVAVSFS